MDNYNKSWALLFETYALGSSNSFKGKMTENGVMKHCKSSSDVFFVKSNCPPLSPVSESSEEITAEIDNVMTLDQIRPGDDLFTSIRFPIRIGTVLGIIPIRGGFGHNSNRLEFTWWHWRTILTSCITLLIGCNTLFITQPLIKILTDTERQSAGELVFAFSGVWFYAAGGAIYLFFVLRSKDLCNYFQLWRKVATEFKENFVPDFGVRGHVAFLTIIVLGSCFSENIMFHFHMMKPSQRARIPDLSFDEFLRDYYHTTEYMETFFDYQSGIAISFLLVNKLTLYAWNFGDVILMVLSRGLYGRFKGLNQFLLNQLTSEDLNSGAPIIRKGSVNWKSIRCNFLSICDLLDEGSRIFAPLIWLSYVTDIFFFCQQLYFQLSPSPPNNTQSVVSSIYVTWSFLHLMMRTLAVNLMGARVNESAHAINHILQYCIPEEYSNDVRRLEQFLGSREIGLTGNGCFVITRSFILMICSAVFTLEVVLLQNTGVTV